MSCFRLEKNILVVDLSKSNHSANLGALSYILDTLGIKYEFMFRENSNVHQSLMDRSIENAKCYTSANYLNSIFIFVRLMFSNRYTFVVFNTVNTSMFIHSLICRLAGLKFAIPVRSVNELFDRSLVPKNISGRLKVFFKKFVYRLSTIKLVGTYALKQYLSTKDDRALVAVVPSAWLGDCSGKTRFSNLKSTTKRVIIPGIVDATKKDILTLLVHSKNYPLIQLEFLGPCKSKLEKDILSEHKNKIGNVIFYDKYLSEDLFFKRIEGADAILGCFFPSFISANGYEEIYMVSKDSGVDGHALSFRLPTYVFVDEKYLLDEKLISELKRNNLRPFSKYETFFNDISNNDYGFDSQFDYTRLRDEIVNDFSVCEGKIS